MNLDDILKEARERVDKQTNALKTIQSAVEDLKELGIELEITIKQ